MTENRTESFPSSSSSSSSSSSTLSSIWWWWWSARHTDQSTNINYNLNNNNNNNNNNVNIFDSRLLRIATIGEAVESFVAAFSLINRIFWSYVCTWYVSFALFLCAITLQLLNERFDRIVRKLIRFLIHVLTLIATNIVTVVVRLPQR